MFSNDGFMPHGHCYLWEPSMVWTMVSTDMLIGLSYVSISLCLYWLVRKIKLPFSMMFLAFGLFIAACGATHFMAVYNLWHANYWAGAFVNLVTAVASVATAILLFKLLPKAVAVAKAAELSEERRRQLEISNRELEAHSQTLNTINRELATFGQSVSHDLRAPLRGIRGFSQILMEEHGDKLDENAKEYLQFIVEGSQRMGKIIEDLLTLARMTQTELRKEKIPVSDLARRSFEDARRSEPSGDRDVQFVLQEDLWVRADASLLRIALDNLFSNALKFSSKMQRPQVEFSARTEGEETVFAIRDNGVGFDPAMHAKLFVAFQRLHSASEYKGTGIGLTTVKRVIERHGGRIWAESNPGQGTTFFFTLGADSARA